MVLQQYWDCTLKMQGDYIVYYNEWGRAIGLFQAIKPQQQDEIRETQQEAALAGHYLKTGRV